MRNFNYSKFFFAITALMAPTLGAQSIATEMSALEKKQMKVAESALRTGDIAFSAEQAENLFRELEISSGVTPGEERVGYVVCTPATVSMGNIDIARCRIEKRKPSFLKK